MRVCAELCADTHAITREDQDNYAIQSFERGIAAQEGGAFTWEIVPVEVSGGRGKPSTVIDKYEGLGKFDAAKFQGERRFCYCWQCFQYKVDKRLKLEHPSPLAPPSTAIPPPPPLPSVLPTESQIQESNFSSRGSLSSAMFLHLDQPSGSESSAAQDSSEPPQAFLSISQEFPPTHQDPSQASSSDHLRTVNNAQDDEMDDIETLMQLLGLSEDKEEQRDDFDDDDCNSCHCEGGFYSKIVGVKGPKCRKEMQRLDGWINHFLNGGGEEKQEPLRLAHLLLGKAAFISKGADGGFGGLEFPSTIQEFLHTDPPCN